MFFVFLFLWTIAIFIFSNENRTISDLWSACTWFLFGFGGISAIFREQADKGLLGWIFPAVAGSIAMLWGPYALLMFSLHFVGKAPRDKKRQLLTAFVVALPIIAFYFAVLALQMFGHAESQAAQDIHTRIMTVLIAPYYLGSAFLITWNLFRERESATRNENISTFLLTVPATLTYYIFAYIVPCFGNLEGWKASFFIMLIECMLFLFFVVKSSAFGLCFQQQNNARERVEKTVIEGTGILQEAMKSNLLSVQHALHNAQNTHLQNEEDMDIVMKDIQTALDSCEQSLSILTRIRLKIHPLRLDLKTCRLIPIMEQVIDQCQIEHTNKNMQIERDFRSNPQLFCDPVHIREVLLNLVNNAIEAVSSDGTGKLVISITSTKNKTIIQVMDNGCGIDKIQSKRLGLPLITAKKGGSHLGLGLYYVKKVIDMHNGQFTLKRVSGEGILAEIILPISHER